MIRSIRLSLVEASRLFMRAGERACAHRRIDAMRAGVNIKHDVEVDRGRAFVTAIGEARAVDVIPIAGKGRGGCQEIAGRRLPFFSIARTTQLPGSRGRA